MNELNFPTKSGQGEITEAPITGIMTAISKASVEIKAGSTKMINRRFLKVRNMSSKTAVKIGNSNITCYSGGMLLEPGALVEYQLDPSQDMAIFCRSMGSSTKLEVTEAK